MSPARGGPAASGAGIKVFSGPKAPPEPKAIERLGAVAALPYVAAPVVALADLHWKEKLETPSSTATGTEGEIVLSLSSGSQNCGMALVRTPLRIEEADSPEFLARLMTALRDEIPRSRREAIVTREDALRFAMGGAPAAAAHFGVDPKMIAGVEEGGALFGSNGTDRAALLDAIDDEALERGRFSFAFVGGGNHFVEIQVVEEVIDPVVGEAFGVRPGDVVVMYHTGSERFGHDLGRLYAVRWKTSRRRRKKYFYRKIPLHLKRARGVGDVFRRLQYHFSRRVYNPVPAGSPDGARLMTAVRAAGNYGYANRVAVLALIQRAIRKATGRRDGDLAVLVDLSHNVIAQERIGGKDLWVHRHNAVRLRPPAEFQEGTLARRLGQPSMLPGTNRTSSYLMMSRAGAAAALNSADHGAGRTVERFMEAGLSREIPDRRTLKFTYRSPVPESLVHVTDEGIEEVVSVLRSNDIAVPALRLRPLAVLKG